MSRAEGFLSRWSRRKQDTDRERETKPSPGLRDDDATTRDGGGGASAPAKASEPTGATCDPARLPPIESISASTDIRSFLLSGVPAAVTRAALRRAWATDPAIFNFIGIAENQWDFTDPAGIPGFGPLTAADVLSAMAGQMLATAEDSLTQIAGSSLPAQAVAPTGTDETPRSVVAGGQDKATQAAAAEEDPSALQSGTSRVPRTHGGALPR